MRKVRKMRELLCLRVALCLAWDLVGPCAGAGMQAEAAGQW